MDAILKTQAEKLAIKAIDLSGRGLTRLAGYLEDRRQEREPDQDRKADQEREPHGSR